MCVSSLRFVHIWICALICDTQDLQWKYQHRRGDPTRQPSNRPINKLLVSESTIFFLCTNKVHIYFSIPVFLRFFFFFVTSSSTPVIYLFLCVSQAKGINNVKKHKNKEVSFIDICFMLLLFTVQKKKKTRKHVKKVHDFSVSVQKEIKKVKEKMM